MKASRVKQFDHLRRVCHFDHLIDLFANQGSTCHISKVRVSVEVGLIQIVIVCWLILVGLRALVGEKLEVAKSALLSNVIKRAQYDE